MPNKFEGPHNVDEEDPLERPEGAFLERLKKFLSRTKTIQSESAMMAQQYPELEHEAMALNKRSGAFLQRAKKVFEIVALATAGTLAAGTGAEALRYQATRYDIAEKQNAAGETVFAHEDEETTKVLDYLSGKGEIPEDVKHLMEVEEVKESFTSNQVPAPPGLAEADEIALSSLFVKERDENRRRAGLRPAGADFGNLRDQIDLASVSRFPQNQALYDALWDLERKVGNPKVRMDMDRFSTPGPWARYDYKTNTIHIGFPGMVERAEFADQDYYVNLFLSEAAHGKQWKDSFATSDIKEYIDEHIGEPALERKAAEEGKTPYQVRQETEYNKPGTIEYEAHHDIEPQLRKEFKEHQEGEPQKNAEDGPHKKLE